MSDFDAALERLVSDPAFRQALAADPSAALAGYRLSPEELELLRSQVDIGDAGAAVDRRVEQRTSKASLFGLLSPLAGAGGIGSGIGDALHGVDDGQGLGPAGHVPAAPAYGRAGVEGLGEASLWPAGAEGASMGRSGMEAATIGPSGVEAASMGPSGVGAGHAGLGPADGGIGAALGDIVGGHGSADDGTEGVATLHSHAAQPPADYHTRVDADGDGRWDPFIAVDRGDRGVDLVVDRDNDGRAEFVGHDFDRDGLIDQATTDTDGDGRLDTRWTDDNGDGWLDRRIPMPDQRSRPD